MKFDLAFIQKIVRENYNLECRVKPLAGDVDYNFLLECEHSIKYVLKICKPQVTEEQIDFQVQILDHLKTVDLDFSIPEVCMTRHGSKTFSITYEEVRYSVRLHSWIPGRMLSEVNPRTSDLFISWGKTCGILSRALQGFDHPGAHRFDKWNPVESLYSRQFIAFFETEEQKEMASYFWGLFENSVAANLSTLRKSVNYSDAHEHNLLVNHDYVNPKIAGIIDFGDAIYAPSVCELAIACAYAGMYVADPIQSMAEVVKGYHSEFELLDLELEVLFPLVCGRLMITVASAAHNFQLDPENEYHQISAIPAWNLLVKLRRLAPQWVHYIFRTACHKVPHPNALLFERWKSSSKDKLSPPVLLSHKKIIPIDLSVGSLDLGNNSNFETIPRFSKKIDDILAEKQADIAIGGYGEVRPFYTTDAYKVEGNSGPQWRTMHLGLDFWTKADAEVLAIWEGEVHALQNNDNPCDYGPTVILKHRTDEGIEFYTLYGHLSLKTLHHLSIGQKVKRGEVIAWIGASDVNGGWPPHLHFQIMLDLLGNEGDFPGVGFVEEATTWLSICPSLDIMDVKSSPSTKSANKEILSRRREVLGKSLSVSYQQPLHMVRGFGIYLYDDTGRRYIDTVNNVAHVGHEHPRVVKAAQRQMELLNTNTRYLHENIVDYAQELLSYCPKEMEVVYFVNSGSEANELALRMARTYASQKDTIALEAGYHGNTGACVDVSSYKFDGKGGKGAPEYTTICSMPDTYRGKYKDPSTAGENYAEDVVRAIDEIKEKGRNVAAFIAESILSCGGQIVLPKNYLKRCYEIVRAEGGLCIADEVQVGFGRTGDYFWAFEQQDVVPDIITCGKPIGNGHPLAAVITTRSVADAFTNGMEYFNTFGGNPVSCAVGKEVLAILEEEGLQYNAKKMGAFLLKGLEELKHKFKIIGDVRGMGLFLGIELVKDRSTLEPADKQATYLVNRMRILGVLMSTDGPLHNVIKIKPPMCISELQAREILMRLESVLEEDFMKV